MKSMRKDSDRLFNTFRTQMEDLEKHSLLAKVRPITEMDHYNLGSQLEQFNEYVAMCEADGTLNQLGAIPKVALDVVTASYGSSPISVIASIQPIDDEHGVVYYKRLVAQTTRGNVTAGQEILSSDQAPQVEPIGYARDASIEYDTAVDTAAGILTYTFTLPQVPVRKYKTTILIKANASFLGLTCSDYEGDGVLMGKDISGTINYVSGSVTINLRNDPTGDANARNILATYSQDMAGAASIPKIIMENDSKPVRADVYALTDTIGLEKAYALRRRFGQTADTTMAEDLVSAINAEMCGTLISKLNSAAIGSVTWSKTPSSGVSYYEHKQEFKDKLAECEAEIVKNAGRGNISVLIAGRNVASVAQTLPGFVKLSDGNSIGPHIFGTLDGMVIIRVPQSGILNANHAIPIYKGANPFESAAVYAPFMPLVVTTALPTGQNPLLNQKAAAVWAAIEILVPNFATKFIMS